MEEENEKVEVVVVDNDDKEGYIRAGQSC